MKTKNKYPLFLIIFACIHLNSGLPALAQKKSKKEPDKTQINESTRQIITELFIDGEKFSVLEEYQKALSNFKKAYDLDPDNSAVCFKIGETLSMLARVGEGIPYLEKAIVLEPKNKFYYNLLAEMYKKENKLNEAAKMYQKLLKNIPEAVEYNYDLANLYLFLGKNDEALVCYKKIEDKYGPSEEITKNKQHIYLKENKIDKAVEEGKKLAAAFPEEPRLVIAYCEILMNNNRNKEAQQVLEKLVEEKPDYPLSRLVLHDLYKANGETEKASNQLKLAFESPELSVEQKQSIIINFARYPDEDYYNTALELAAISVKVHPDDAKILSLYGDLLAGKKELVDAKLYYKKSLGIDNSAYEVWRQIVYIEFQSEHYDSAQLTSIQALDIFPNQGEMWMLNGESWLVQKKYIEASKSFENAKKLLKSDPNMLGEVLAALGDSYHYTKEHKKSDQSYEEALALNPDNHRVLNNYAYFLSLRNERLDDAKRMSSRLALDFPDNSTYLDTHGWVLYKRGEYDEALKYIERAVTYSESKGESPSGEVLEHYGDVLFKLGNKDLALEYWLKAQKKGDTSDFLLKKITDKKMYE